MPVATMTGRMAASESAATASGSGAHAVNAGGGRRGRRPASVSFRAKLERSRQSARECRARKKLRYQYLEELVASREKAIFALRDELKMFKEWCVAVDGGEIPQKLVHCLEQHRQRVHCMSTSSIESSGDMAAESKPTVSLHSPTVSSSLGSPQQLQSASIAVKTEDPFCNTTSSVKTEPADTRWRSRMVLLESRVADKNVALTSAATSAGSSVPEVEYAKQTFLNQSLPDTVFDIADETLSLSDVFDFDN